MVHARIRLVAMLCLLGSAPALLAQDKLITEGDAIKYFKGTEEPPVEWNQATFDDSGWLDGSTPIGYSADIVYNTVLDDMLNAYLTVYVRREFAIAVPTSVRALRLSMKVDDGFIAYINGVEVIRRNMPAGAVTKDTLGTDHETNITFDAANTFVLPCAAVEALRAGDNVLAIEGHNVAIGSSDFTLSFELETISSICPTNLTCTPRDTATGPNVVLRWTKPTGAVYDDLKLFRNGTLVDPPVNKNGITYTDRTPSAGLNEYRLVATGCGVECTGADVPTCSATVGGTEPTFRRGDADANNNVNLTDALKVLGQLFQGQPASACLDAADADDSGRLNLTDALYLLAALFQGGPQPPLPGRDACGVDPTADELAPCVSACQ